MSYLLDTNVLSEIRKGEGADAAVRAWWSGTENQDLHTSVMVIGEIRRGIEALRPRSAANAHSLERWLESVIDAFGERLLDVDRGVADVWGSITVKRTLPLVDGLLAATAIVHDLTLVTRNTKDIADCGARLLNPWEFGGDR